MQGLFFGSSTWARTRDLRINRNPGSSNVFINQWLTSEKHKRVIESIFQGEKSQQKTLQMTISTSKTEKTLKIQCF